MSRDKPCAINRTIRILHIMKDTFAYGGTPRKILSLVANSNKEEICHIFLLFANTTPNLNQELREAGAIVEEVRRQRNWDIRLIWDIIKMLRRYRCNIINTHFARADIFGTIAGVLTRTPVIKFVHGIVWNDSRLLQRIDFMLSHYRVYTICNSEATKRVVIEETGAMNTQVIYVGIPDVSLHLTAEKRAIKRIEFGLPQDAFVVGCIGGMIALRDHSTVLRALKQCLEHGINAHLVFLGDGPLRKELETECLQLGLSEQTRFLGYRSDVVELISIFDVYVNMARKEGFGIAVVEAMQTGIPVILANAGSLPELIEDGVSGLLVPPGDADCLARKLVLLANDKELRKRLGEEARRRAKSLFSIDRYVKDIEDVYRTILMKP